MSQSTLERFNKRFADATDSIRDHTACVPDDSTDSEDWANWGKEFLRRKVRLSFVKQSVNANEVPRVCTKNL
jgi:hypothetical protein